METLRSTPFIITYLDAVNKLLVDVWQEGSQGMNPENFKTTLTQWKQLVIENAVTAALIDARQMKFMIDPDLQEWSGVHVAAPAAEAGLRKMATLLPTSIFEKVSVQQTINEHPDRVQLKRQYFDSENEAKQWLLG
ncbi:hypothetical protein [Microscilla marina]|uniref:STAS/SEC14 domain-containing protein n=1 Tax=Microscilla marina ATCC 23134 TaxID=313606 RepID=A1ZG15_MICM2|nr:hypothetical protein [Microscilla marina]EAY30432.1 hypothetical protein M23134_03068 [Microscilla marina ATCC 23134]